MSKIIAYTVDKKLGVFNSLGESCNTPSYFDFLLKDYGKDTIKVFSHIDYDVANLLALELNEQQLKTLSDTERTTKPPYRMRYFSGKLFGIDKGSGYGHPEAFFSDVAQYDSALDKVSDIHTPEYLIDRAKYACKVGQEVYNALVKLHCQPDSLISPANVFMKSNFHSLNLPTVDDIPYDALNLAYKCAKGNWLECYTRGHFDHVYDYDLTTAYAGMAANLYDLRYGKWVHSNDYQKDALYGYIDGEASIDANFHPILYKIDEHLTFTPNDSFNTQINKGKLDYINNHNIGWFTNTDAWWWIPDRSKPQVTNLKGMISWLFKKKQTSEGMERKVIKRVLAGNFYGMFLQTVQKKGETELGDYFMSPWGAEIESNCQLLVAETCVANNITPIHVAVDGFTTTKPIPTPNPDGLGQWRLSYEGKSLVCGTGLVTIEGKVGEGDFSVSYDWLVNAIKKDPQNNSYVMTKKTILTLHKAVEENKLSELGDVINTERSIDIDFEQKRDYDKSPKCGNDLLTHQYTSRPWDAKMINLMVKSNSDFGSLNEFDDME